MGGKKKKNESTVSSVLLGENCKTAAALTDISENSFRETEQGQPGVGDR